MERKRILEQAAEAVDDREGVYGPPAENFACFARYLRAFIISRHGYDVPITAADIACINILQKIARLDQLPFHGDSWVDIAGYAALGGEVAEAGE